MKIVEYKNVWGKVLNDFSGDINRLSENINWYIENGWVPVGNVVVDRMNNLAIYIQTMVKYMEETTCQDDYSRGECD